MKKLIFISSLLIIVTSSYSQINKGQWLVGGSASLSMYKYASGYEKVTAVTFAPNAGYFFANNFAGGARVSFSSLKAKGEQDAESSFLFAPFVRYYFLPTAQKVNLFADASYGIGSMKSGGKSEGWNQYAFAAGPAVFLSPNTAIEFTLQFSSAGGDAYAADRMTNFGFNVGFQVHLGK